MNELSATLWIETRKALRSKVPLITGLGFLMLPLAISFLMFVYKNPDFARDMGMVSAKANLAGGSADWPFFLSMYAQGISIGGLLLFSLILAWVFGREFSDGTLKDVLAVPVARGTIVAAKFLVSAAWGIGLTVFVYLVGLGLASLIGLAQFSPAVLARGTLSLAVTALLVMVVVTPVAFFAMLGRGYLLPLGLAILILALANIVAVLGWGDYFPWSIPSMYAGLTGAGGLAPASWLIVLFTGAGGVAVTYLWWKYADQNK